MELPHRYDVSRDMPGHAMAPAAARARSEGSATSDGLMGAISVGRNLGVRAGLQRWRHVPNRADH
jgi:hypothetical protein